MGSLLVYMTDLGLPAATTDLKRTGCTADQGLMETLENGSLLKHYMDMSTELLDLLNN